MVAVHLAHLTSAKIGCDFNIGNNVCNKIWEANTYNRLKPSVQSSREEKERWIRAKYEHKEFLGALRSNIKLDYNCSRL